ncbi:MAG: LysM peptidoglycan-binding domain-containing protein [Desulfonatronovibrionaceae bacterium]
MRKEELLRYKVRAKEHLYQIMRSFGLTNEQISRVIPEIKELNPHIEDLSNLQPGQTLILPVLKSSKKALSEQMERWKAKPVNTQVRSGDSVVSMLRRIGGVPHYLIFNEYLNLFRDLNPELENIDQLEPGQEVSLPVYTGEGAKSGAQEEGQGSTVGTGSKAGDGSGAEESENSTAVRVQEREEKRPKIEEAPAKGQKEKDDDDEPVHPLRERCLTALEALGLKRVPGKTMYFPREDGSWLRIDLKYTPVIKDYSGRKILLAEKEHLKKWESGLKDTDIDVCRAYNWDPQAVLEWIDSSSSREIRIWKHDRPFVASIGNVSLEFKADLIAKVQGRGMHVVNFVSGSGSGDMARNFLRSLGIEYFEFRVLDSGHVESAFDKVSLSSIYIPEEARAQPADISRLQRRGSEKDGAGEKNIRLNLLDDGEHELVLSLSVQTVPDGRLVLSGKAANPYLFALLKMAGHECLMVR